MAFLFPLLHKSSNSFFGHNYSLLGLYPFMIFYYLQSMHNCKKWGKVPITISIHYLLLNYTILYLEYPGNDKKGHSKPTFFMFNSRKVIPLCHIFSLQMCSVWSSTGCTEYWSSMICPVYLSGHQDIRNSFSFLLASVVPWHWWVYSKSYKPYLKEDINKEMKNTDNPSIWFHFVN